jgi:hypothetical protein
MLGVDEKGRKGLGRGLVFTVRAEGVEGEAFDRAARLHGMTRSAWMRRVCREAAVEELGRVGERVPW